MRILKSIGLVFRNALFRGTFAAILIIISAPTPARAFGVLGHQVAASLAEDMLTPKAKSEVVKLLAPAGGSTSLASIAVWADDIKSLRPQTRSWHYITIQIGDTGAKADPARADTPNVVTVLNKQLAILKKKDADRYAREEALKWVVHLVGDLHQPLHAGEDHDKGGNLLQVRVNRRAYNLHAVWDHVLLERLKLPADSIKLLLEREIAAEPIWLDRNAQGTPAAWAKATHALAAGCYLQRGKPLKKGIKSQLEKDYVREATLVSLTQLKLAGARLAFALNEALDSGGFGTGLPKPGGGRPQEDEFFSKAEGMDGENAGETRQARPASANPASEREPDSRAKTAKKAYQEARPTFVYKRYSWSVNSKVYHYSICADVRRILRKNLETEDHAPAGRSLHSGCPVP